jgi:3-oxoacyl-[acyl-carrier protein] reductase
MIVDLKNKNALVCGGSKGIGKAIAIELAKAGASVTLIARNEETLDRAKKQLPCPHDQEHNYIVADFSKPEYLKEKISLLTAKKIPIHILINNNGAPPANFLIDTKTSDLMNTFSTFILSYQILAQAVIPGMKQENYGRIINIVSTSMKQPIPQLPTSSIVSSVVKSWAKSLANEMAPFGITVNNVLPGSTKTQTLVSFYEYLAQSSGKPIEDIFDEKVATIPMKRLAKPEEIAYAVTFLASPFATYITGVNLPVDGGKIQCI